MELFTIGSQGLTYIAIFVFGLIVGSVCLGGWFYQRYRLYKSTVYFKKTNLNLWEHFKRNIALVASIFFYVIAISAMLMWLS